MSMSFRKRRGDIMDDLIRKIKGYTGKPIKIMEVCGTHTMNIERYGIKKILPPQVEMISGPGCPVCVTPVSYFMALFEYIHMHPCIVASFGDLLKVPFGGTSLLKERSRNFDIRIVYSPLECLQIARENPKEQVVFLGVGFETTAPLTALLVSKAKQEGIRNLKVALAHKSIIPALKLLLEDKGNSISALLYPGNVGAVIGSDAFWQISKTYRIKGSVCGFKAEEILKSIYFLLYGEELFRNQYQTVVYKDGNIKARNKMDEVFGSCDSVWRGIGQIRQSGYLFRSEYAVYGVEEMDVITERNIETNDCLCGEIIKGKRKPVQCRYFGKQCTPFSPIGPCMVSNEGACSAVFIHS